MGARLLRSWVLRPLIESAAIEAARAVAHLVQQTVVRGEIRKELKGILDLERLTSRITWGLRLRGNSWRCVSLLYSSRCSEISSRRHPPEAVSF